MADVVRISPEQLRLAGDEVTVTGESLLALHHTCLTDAESAHCGWVGTSAGALAGLLDRWTAASRSHGTRISEQAIGLHSGATEFADMEYNHAAALDGCR